MDTAELQSLKIKELTKLAQEMNVQNFAGLKKQELIVTILEAEAKNDGVLYSRGYPRGDGRRIRVFTKSRFQLPSRS